MSTYPSKTEVMSTLYPTRTSPPTPSRPPYPPIYTSHARLPYAPLPFRYVGPPSPIKEKPSFGITLFETNARSNLLGDLTTIFKGASSCGKKIVAARHSIPVPGKVTKEKRDQRTISAPIPSSFVHVGTAASMSTSTSTSSKVYSNEVTPPASAASTDSSFFSLAPSVPRNQGWTPQTKPLPLTPASSPLQDSPHSSIRSPRARGVLRKQRSYSWEARAINGWTDGDSWVKHQAEEEEEEEEEGDDDDSVYEDDVPSWLVNDDIMWQKGRDSGLSFACEGPSKVDKRNGNWI